MVIVVNGDCMPRAGKYSFPKHDIDWCVERVRKIAEICGDVTSRETAAKEALGMSPTGGETNTLFASMEMYGLIETGEGQIKLTDLAKKIIYAITPEEAEREKGEAVRKIGLFVDIYEMYGENPSDVQLRAFLRDKAGVEPEKIAKITPQISKVFKRVVSYLKVAAVTPTSMGVEEEKVTGKAIKPEEVEELRFGDVRIWLPKDNPAEAWKRVKKAVDVYLGIEGDD